MASGDTKTQQYLDVAANGTRADLPSDTCCETRTQTLTREVAERVIALDEEVQEIKNNPDVVDIVDTYADLQAYDTQHLTDNDIIRVLQDETHDGNSTYYRFTKNPDTWTFIGEISGGEVIKTLTAADYNWNSASFSATEPYNSIAMWLLPQGLYAFSDFSTQICIGLGSTITAGKNGVYLSSLRYDYYHPENPYTAVLYKFNGYVDGTQLVPAYITNISNGVGSYQNWLLSTFDVQDNLTSGSTVRPLSANQGKVLNGRLGGLSFVSISQTDYDNLQSKDPDTLYVITGA